MRSESPLSAWRQSRGVTVADLACGFKPATLDAAGATAKLTLVEVGILSPVATVWAFNGLRECGVDLQAAQQSWYEKHKP